MADPKMQQLKDRFAKTSGNPNQNNYYPFYKMPDDAQARIRFLPDANEDNSMGFLIEKVSHTLIVNGEKKTVPCLSQYEGHECPVCKVAKEFYDNDDKVRGKQFYKNRTYLAQALVLEDPIVEAKYESAEGKVKLVSIGYSLFKIIKDAFESGELDTPPYAYQDGTDFLIKKTKQGEFASYTLSKFARKSTDLTDAQEALASEQIVDLSTLLPKMPDINLVNKLLEAALTGKRLAEDDDDGDDDNAAFAAMAKKNKAKDEDSDSKAGDSEKAEAPKATERAAPPASDDGDDDAEAEALLAQLKAKRAAAAAG